MSLPPRMLMPLLWPLWLKSGPGVRYESRDNIRSRPPTPVIGVGEAWNEIHCSVMRFNRIVYLLCSQRSCHFSCDIWVETAHLSLCSVLVLPIDQKLLPRS